MNTQHSAVETQLIVSVYNAEFAIDASTPDEDRTKSASIRGPRKPSGVVRVRHGDGPDGVHSCPDIKITSSNRPMIRTLSERKVTEFSSQPGKHLEAPLIGSSFSPVKPDWVQAPALHPCLLSLSFQADKSFSRIPTSPSQRHS